ncbi:hypothetical protein OIDMADRAFT_22549 [Oidiodendron maius Zn]|uniref:Phosphoribosylaminoimidazole-succinocarboxamide synthase n=1 Tax=Oidiodendron maius (strain Zn) TaxID=913774 RepID=A0A0C3HHL8_OIDMZ|nr:hypothetical protein OIDMADRAFT_22549 [Oidiodendron maius Zn]
MDTTATSTSLETLPKIASGKVRELFETVSRQQTSTVHGIPIAIGLREAGLSARTHLHVVDESRGGTERLELHISEAAVLVGAKYAQRIEDLAIQLYTAARDYAAQKGIIIANTKFEFGLDEDIDEVLLVDEV